MTTSFENVEDAFQLTPIQAGMLYDSLATADEDIYVTYVTSDVVGYVEPDRFKRAWNSTFNMHQALRAEFHWDGLEEPLQVITREIDLPLVNLDWSGEDAFQQSVLMSQLMDKERLIKMDLSQAPLSRITLIKIAETRWRLLWSVHHLLADGVSTPRILKDVLERYSSGRECKKTDEQVYQYSQYVSWLRSQNHQAASAYWSTYLNGASTTPTNLRTCSDAASIRNTTSELKKIPQFRFSLSQSQTGIVTEYCQNHRITLSTFLHAAWALLLQKYSNCDSVLFASTVSGRHADLNGMEQAVGLYLNAQPRWIKTTSGLPLTEWMRSIQLDIHNSAKYDYSRLSELQENIVTENSAQPFESVITIGGHSSELNIGAENSEIHFSGINYQITQSHYPLAFIATPGSSLNLELVYEAHRYYGADIQAMAEYLKSLIEVMAANANTPTAELNNLVLPQSLAQGVAPIAGSGMETIHQWFETVAHEYPKKPCILFKFREVTYEEVDTRANQIAHLLQRSITTENVSLIGIMLPRSAEQIIALLGILKAGYAYVPLDPTYPSSTIQTLVEAAGISHVVTDKATLSDCTISTGNYILIENSAELSGRQVGDVQGDRDSLAYVMFTSGSTGLPKGVKITHANLLYSTATRIDYYQKLPASFLLLSSIAFDSSVAGIYWSLCSGGKLVLPEPDQEKDVHSVAQLIQSGSVTHTLCLPSYYRLLLNYAEVQQLAGLNVVIVAGESCPPELVELHNQQHADVNLYNEYGPTEACVWSSVYKFNNESVSEIPIGKSVGTTYLECVDGNGFQCPVGVRGEIVIGGPGVSPGYYNDTAQTVKRFTANPVTATDCAVIYRTGDLGYRDEHGDIVFSGRLDRQVKIRGYRIEPGDIEAVLSAHPEIMHSAVLPMDQTRLSANDDDSKDGNDTPVAARSLLVAYYVEENTQEIDPGNSACEIVDGIVEQELRDYCLSRLPLHMCPARFIALSDFPVLSNGKISYKDFPVPNIPDRSYESPADQNESEVSKLLIGLLKNLLGTDDVRPEHNFFEIGGDSITAIQFVSQARSAGITIGVVDFTHSRSIAEIVALSESSKSDSANGNSTIDKDNRLFASSGLSETEIDDFLDGL